MRKIIIFLVLFLLSCGLAGATDYYVATTGNNSNPGSLESPFLTISYAIDYAHDGDTIYINSGTYNEQVKFTNLIEPRITVIGVGDSKPIVTYEGGGATVEFGTHNMRSPNATGHVIQNLDIRNTGNATFDAGKGILFAYGANVSDIVVEACNVSVIRRAIHMSVGAHSNITIQNCNIRTKMGDGIKCEPTGLSTVNILNNNIWAAEDGYYSTTSSGIFVNGYCIVNITDNRVYFSGYTGIKSNPSTGLYENNTIYESGYAHNAFENIFTNAIIKNTSILGYNSTQITGGSKSGNIFYSAGGADCYNASIYNFYTNNTTWNLCTIGGHQHDYYVENFMAENHDGTGFFVFGFSDSIYPVKKYSSNNIVFKNCSLNTSLTASAYPLKMTCLGTNTSSNPAPYLDQSLSGFTRDHIAFINFRMGGNYNIGLHDWYISDRLAGAANAHHHGDVKLINCNPVDDIYFDLSNPINCSTTVESMYYADVKLQYGNGTPIPEKSVTFATTAINPETLTTLTPVNVNASSGQKSYVDTLSSTTSGATGRTPLPSNISHTIAITDFVKNKTGSTDVNWSVDADGVILENINPGENWYRSEQDTSKYTITAIKNSSENTHITGFAPSVEENTFSAGDEVTYQVWLSEDADSISWKKNGVEVATDTLTYRDTFSTDPVVMSFSATDANGDVSYTWDYNPEALPVAEFSADVTSGTAPLTVQFTDLSENALSWYWDFDNDGTVDNSTQNPEYIYSTAGTYTVNLTVQNGENADSEVKELYISVESPSIITSYWNSFWAWWGMRWQVTYWLQEAV